AGLMAATVGTAFGADQPTNPGADLGLGEGGHPMTRQEMTKNLADFCAYTQQNWSIWGFESVGQARASLGGGGTGDWFYESAVALGATTGNVCARVASSGSGSGAGGGGSTGSGTGSGGATTQG